MNKIVYKQTLKKSYAQKKVTAKDIFPFTFEHCPYIFYTC